MAECAAQLFREGMAEWILPSGKYSVVNGEFSGVLEKSDIYNKEYETEWEFLKEVLIKKWCSGGKNPEGRSGNFYV